jgi:hypothetical protein
MKALWKNVKQSATIAVAKVTNTSKDEDPAYITKSELLRKIEADSISLSRALQDWAHTLNTHSTTSLALSSAFVEAFNESDAPYFATAVRSREGLATLGQCHGNLQQTHIPHFCIEKLSEFQARIRSLAALREARKQSRILMLNEEKKLKEAQERHSAGLEHREERYNAQKIEYERLHTQFMAGIEEIEQAKVDVFGRVFHCYRFYLMELVELQHQVIVQQIPDFPYETLKQELPSAVTNIDVQPAEVTVRIDLSDDQND